MLRYCRGIDRADPDLVRACYHPDATDEHGSFSGTIDAFMVWVMRVTNRYSMSMHFVGNQLVELGDSRGDGTRNARCETYGISHHRSENDDPTGNLRVGFRYIDRFERRSDGAWRIAARICTTEWVRVDDAENQWTIPAGMRRGQRNSSDPVYAPFDDERTKRSGWRF